MIEDDLKKDVEKQINELDLQIEMVEKSKWIEQKNLLGQSSKLIYWFAKCHKRPPHYGTVTNGLVQTKNKRYSILTLKMSILTLKWSIST